MPATGGRSFFRDFAVWLKVRDVDRGPVSHSASVHRPPFKRGPMRDFESRDRDLND